MANGDLQFGVHFDIEQGVKEAIAEGDKGLKKIQDAIDKRAINIKLKLDTGRTRAVQSELVGFRKQLSELTREWNALSAAERGGAQGAALRERYRVLQREAQGYVSTLNAAVKQEDKLAAAAARAAVATNKLTKEFKKQDGYVSRLIKRLAVYAGFQQITSFLTNIREVTAQFELQRVSLGAIIQDQTRANQLFSEIKQFALKSPVSILDLTKYTKQVAAYGIETDKLFDTTKRIMDVSVGLGIDASRLVLAFGQVKAASYLRAAEIRQFTEAGIPMLELLAEKFTKLNGEMVTTEQVMDMVSKRGVGFSMVEEIFNDMTSAGGMFYNMQEKQGNTLYGLWAKLGDAASVMYEQIGNTSWVNEGMKKAIEGLTDLMRNWKSLAREIGLGAAGFAVYTLFIKKLTIDSAKLATATTTATLAQRRHNLSLKIGGKYLQFNTLMASKAAAANVAAANATTLFSRSFYKLKAAMLGNWMTAILVAVGVVIEKLYTAFENANRLKEALDKIEVEGMSEQNKSVRNFEYLADAAVKAADGSKAQRDALEELERTYKNIIPVELLSIENLRLLKGNYDALTNSIRQYIQEQTKRKAADEITAEYGVSITKQEREIAKYVESLGVSETQAWGFVREYSKQALDETKTLEEKVTEAFSAIGIELDKQDKEFQNKAKKLFSFYKGGGDIKFTYDPKIKELNELYVKQEADLANLEVRYNNVATASSKFAEAQAKLAEKIANTKIVKSYGDKGEIDRDSYLGQQVLKNENIKGLGDILKEEFKKADLEWQSGFGNFIQKVNAAKPELISSLDFTAIINSITEKLKDPYLKDAQRELLGDLLTTAQEAQKRYMEIVPSDPVVRFWQQRFRIIANSVGEFQSRHNKYLIKAGEGLEGYNKRLKDELEGLKNNVKGLVKMQEKILKAGIFAKLLYGVSAEEVKKLIDEANEDIKMIEKALEEQPNFDKGKKSKSHNSDPRLSILQEMVSTLKQVNKEYDELAKKEGTTKALVDTQEKYANTFKYLQSLATKYKFDLPDFGVPTDAKSLTKYLDAVKIAMAKLPKSEKSVLSLETDIADIRMNEAQKKIQAELQALADRISRTKTAKEFYDKILSQTGDMELAATLSFAVHGEDGKALKQQIIDNIQATLGKTKDEVNIDFTAAIRTDKSVDYDELVRITNAQLKLGNISEDTYTQILKMRDDDRKDLAKTVEGWLKATEKAKTYSDKLLDLARTTGNEIAEINRQKSYSQARVDTLLGKESLTAEEQTELTNLQNFLAEADTLIQRFRDKQDNEEAKLGFEAFKDSPMYVQMFDDLDHASTTMLENMKARITAMQTAWKDLDPTQLKELQSRLNEIDEQLAKRNPFKGLVDGIKEYQKMGGRKGEKAADQTLIDAAKAANDARVKYEEILHKDSATKEEIAEAKDELDKAMSNEEAAQKAVENWKKVKDTIGLSANELFQMLNWAGDIAGAIADISEAMGADEEDVQYWNDVASALGDIAGGIQDIVQSAMSGNVVGMISSTLTAIPKMFVGFTNLFSAGKIKKANKEIKRQQELLDQLEYTYNRLQDAADKLFGNDYISNYNAQVRNLQAQQTAYLKQAEAERSKGKKKDTAKIKEYEDAARDAADEIRKLKDELTAKFTGVSREDAAREFAQSWLEAKATFASTTDAIKSKYKDMIQSMIIEGAAAKIIDRILAPMWDRMNDMLKNNNITGAIDYLVNGMDQFIADADNGMNVLWKSLEARGYDIQKLLGDTDASGYTGIKRELASASEETMNNVAMIGNTLMYYVSPIPAISENVAMMRLMMEGKQKTGNDGMSTVALQQQAMDNLAAIERHTAETVAECRLIALKCQEQTDYIKRVIIPKSSSANYVVATKLLQ